MDEIFINDKKCFDESIRKISGCKHVQILITSRVSMEFEFLTHLNKIEVKPINDKKTVIEFLQFYE